MKLNKTELNILLDTTVLLEMIKRYDAIEKTNKSLDYGVTMAHLNNDLEALSNLCKTEVEKTLKKIRGG